MKAHLIVFLWIVFSIGVSAADPGLPQNGVTVLDVADDFVDAGGSSTFVYPLDNDAVYGLRSIDPLSFKIIGEPHHGMVFPEVGPGEVSVLYSRSEPGADAVAYEVCLADEVCDTGVMWFLESAIGPLASGSSDRAESIMLADAFLSGKVHIFVPDVLPQGAVGSVRFLVDGEPAGYERNAPYDLAGGTTTRAYPFDTTRLSDGWHQVTTEIKFTPEFGGSLQRIETLTRVANTPLLAFSYANDRNSAGILDGGYFGGNVFVFLGIFPLNPGVGPVAWIADGVSAVQFLLDGRLVRTERTAPYDFGGGAIDEALPFNMATLTPGAHTLSAVVVYANGHKTVVTARFQALE
jgi:hypothetical protein